MVFTHPRALISDLDDEYSVYIYPDTRHSQPKHQTQFQHEAPILHYESDCTESDSDEDDDNDYIHPVRLWAPDINAMRTHLADGTNHWTNSRTRKRLQQSLASKQSTPISSIKTIACLALGTIAKPPDSRARINSTIQLACLLDLVACIAHHPSRQPCTSNAVDKITIYAQDPDFEELDKQLLTEHGVTVIENNKIWSLIDESTLVFAPFFPSYALPRRLCNEQFKQGQGPAAMMWYSLKPQDQPEARRDKRLGWLCRNVTKGYEGEGFPHAKKYRNRRGKPIVGECFEKVREGGKAEVEITSDGRVCQAFNGLQIYWRKDGDS